jgi:hypothetical protein
VADQDSEVARLRAEVEALKARSQPSVVGGTLKVLATLVGVAFVGLVVVVIIANTAPPPPTLSEQQAECERVHGAAPSYALNQCKARNIQRELDRMSR